ncbi:hypothetical protein L0222_32845 [bacterium]|nr:hypothetical protein [bacterium]
MADAKDDVAVARQFLHLHRVLWRNTLIVSMREHQYRVGGSSASKRSIPERMRFYQIEVVEEKDRQSQTASHTLRDLPGMPQRRSGADFGDGSAGYQA